MEQVRMENGGLPAPAENGEAEMLVSVELESVRVPSFAILAALGCVDMKANAKSRSYLNGVHVCRHGDDVRLMGTDGHRAFVYGQPSGNLPEWLEAGVTLPAEDLAPRVKLLEQLGHENLDIAYGVKAPYVTLSDSEDASVFKLFIEEGGHPFPAKGIEDIIGRLKFTAHEAVDLASVTVNSAYLKGAAALATTLGSKEIRMFGTVREDGDPVLFDFPECPGAILLVMPMKRPVGLSAQTARLLEAPVAGTVAALRAHRTRQEQQLERLGDRASERQKASIRQKIVEYDQRIAAILGQPALPAPEAEEEEEEPFSLSDQEDGEGEPAPELDESQQMQAVETVELWAAETSSGPALEAKENRAKLKGGARSNALKKFYADINAALSDAQAGVTINGLADGVPLDDWWQMGLSPAQAAERCLSWKPKN
jgi:DNA polymerase III beta subunit, central domain